MAPTLSADTIEKAVRATVEETDALRDSLRGVDLQIYRQNQKLRSENQRLIDEVEALSTKNVNLVFQTKELEEMLEELRGSESERVTTLTAELDEARAAQARQTEELDAARLRLDQSSRQMELARQRVTEAEKKAYALQTEGRRLLAERQEQSQKQLDDAVRRVEAERERAQRLETELAGAKQRIAQLETTIDELKNQYLTALEPRRAPAGGPAGQSACRALTQISEQALGVMGRSLVQQAFARCRVDAATEDPAEIARVIEQVRAAAPKLVSDATSLQKLNQSLDRLLLEHTGELGTTHRNGVAARVETEAPELPAPPVAETKAEVVEETIELPEPMEEAIELPSPAVEAVIELPSPVAEPIIEVPAPPAQEEPQPEVRIELPAPIEQPPAVKVKVKAPVPDKPRSVANAAEEVMAKVRPTAAPEVILRPRGLAPKAPPQGEKVRAEHLLRQLTRPATRPSRASQQAESHGLKPTCDPELLGRIEECQKHLEEGDFRLALRLFERLDFEARDCLQIRHGLFHSLVGMQEWKRAHDVGAQLYGLLGGQRGEDFQEAMTSVLKERLQQLRSAAEKKHVLLELAELNMNDRKQALRFLRQAELLPDRIPGGGRIPFHLTRLLEDSLEDRAPHLLGYMRSLTDRTEMFDHIRQIYNHPRHRKAQPVARAILALAHRSRSEAEEAQRHAGTLLAPREARPDMLAELNNPIETSVTKFCLDRLLPEAGVELEAACAQFESRVEGSIPAPHNSRVTETILEAARFFQIEKLRIRYREDGEEFLIDAAGEPTPTIVFHRRAETLGRNELRFMVFRKLWQLKRRHLELFRKARQLDDRVRYRLVKTYLDLFRNAGAPIPEDLIAEMEALPGRGPEGFAAGLGTVLDRLHAETGSDAFSDLKEFILAERPFSEQLDCAADSFACRLSGLTAACYALTRTYLDHDPLMERIESEGLELLYTQTGREQSGLRRRIQTLWAQCLEAAQEDL